MDSMVSISIGKFDFISYKNDLQDLLTVYSENDRHIKEMAVDGEKHRQYYFSTTVKRAQNCLDILGHTMMQAKHAFEYSKVETIGFLEHSMKDKEKANCYKQNFMFDAWCDAVKKFAVLLSKDTFSSECEFIELEKKRKGELSFTEQIVIDTLPFSTSFWGIEILDDYSYWDVFRVILEAFPSDQEVIVDYTDLYEGGWCEEYPPVDINIGPKTIILTEGKSDADAISASMHILYPYMEKYYSLIDFSNYKVMGSTSYITHYLKAFIGARIENRIIALYDNDAAGISEMKNLESITLPENVRVIHLPDLEICKDYPTIGPSGKEYTNINGRGCSIELFFGRDVISQEKEFIPVIWRSYIDKTKTYQGVIDQKDDIQKRFAEKTKKAIDEKVIEKPMWEEMDMLLRTIFCLFNSTEQ